MRLRSVCQLASHAFRCQHASMVSGYEKSPDYGSPPPKHAWLGFVLFIAFFAALLAFSIWRHG